MALLESLGLLGALAWKSSGHGRVSKAAAKMNVLIGLISVVLVHCVTSDFQSTFSSMLEASLKGNMTVLIKERAGKKYVQVLAD